MHDMNAQSGDRTVYVKTIAVTDLPQEVRDQAEGLDQLYAVHDAQGQQLALVGDRKLAFVLARQHDYAPVMVH
ncbi:DUF1150 family protein [Sulfitobacter sp. JBTF-M27]|jgi:hypothetical protein|uniref:DUF1150 family protein n=1 Tax=Sulfitobacter sediminilitoris TaxID=2698830 RepID=A0A6P0C9F0_9RHOB|nr:DUF1150 family protein [Sulfitobacter sediminilitoris]NEK22487.1 DUF1150 family protein [Sulfitobacter sediminilitoris]